MGEDTTDAIEISEESALVVDATHKGESNFQVQLIDLETGKEEWLINETGAFDGRIVAHVTPGQYAFNVVYDRDYTLEPTGIDPGDIREPPFSMSGHDYAVVPVQLESPVRLELAAQTDSNVQVIMKNSVGNMVDYIFNETGPGEFATTITTEGIALFYLKMVDEWELSIDSF
jgi:hypothetical protein